MKNWVVEAKRFGGQMVADKRVYTGIDIIDSKVLYNQLWAEKDSKGRFYWHAVRSFEETTND